MHAIIYNNNYIINLKSKYNYGTYLLKKLIINVI
jgi:hypothetical protein